MQRIVRVVREARSRMSRVTDEDWTERTQRAFIGKQSQAASVVIWRWRFYAILKTRDHESVVRTSGEDGW